MSPKGYVSKAAKRKKEPEFTTITNMVQRNLLKLLDILLLANVTHIVR
jgi:hypothetical protein